MRKFVLFIFLFCLMMPVQVQAMELPPEETIEEVVDEVVEEVTEDEVPADNTEMLEKLDAINGNLIAIEFTLLFMVGVHYTEKWIKLAMSRIKDSGRVI